MLEKSKVKSRIKKKNIQEKQKLIHQPCSHSWEEKQVGCCKKFVCRSCGKMWMDKNPPFETGLRTKTFRESYGENRIDRLSLIKDQILNRQLIKKLSLTNNDSKKKEEQKRYSFFKSPNGLYLPQYHLGIEDQFPSSSVSALKNGVRSTVTAGGVMMMGGGVAPSCTTSNHTTIFDLTGLGTADFKPIDADEAIAVQFTTAATWSGITRYVVVVRSVEGAGTLTGNLHVDSGDTIGDVIAGTTASVAVPSVATYNLDLGTPYTGGLATATKYWLKLTTADGSFTVGLDYSDPYIEWNTTSGYNPDYPHHVAVYGCSP